MDPHRHQRVTETLREELEEILNYELTDPRIGGVSVTDVHVASDYRKAVIRLALKGSAAEQQSTLDGINHAKSFIKNQLADRLDLYRTPELEFTADLSADLAAKASKVLKRIRRGRPKRRIFASQPRRKKSLAIGDLRHFGVLSW